MGLGGTGAAYKLKLYLTHLSLPTPSRLHKAMGDMPGVGFVGSVGYGVALQGPPYQPGSPRVFRLVLPSIGGLVAGLAQCLDSDGTGDEVERWKL